MRGRWRRTVEIPAVAIAGINAENVDEVLATGIKAVAVTAAVAGSDDPRRSGTTEEKARVTRMSRTRHYHRRSHRRAEQEPAVVAPAKSFLSHAKLIGGLTFVSRIVGMAREIVAGHFLGTGIVASAFTVAFTIPNLFRKLLGEGALSAAFIPLYAQAEQTRARPKTASRRTISPPPASTCSCMILLGITLIGEAIIAAFIFGSSGDRPDRVLMLKFTAIMLPYVLLVCGGAFLSAILQVHKRFGPPAFAPILLNVVPHRRRHRRRVVPRPARRATADAARRRAADDAGDVARVHRARRRRVAGRDPAAGAAADRLPLPHRRCKSGRRRSGRCSSCRSRSRIGAGVLQLSVLLDKGIATP